MDSTPCGVASTLFDLGQNAAVERTMASCLAAAVFARLRLTLVYVCMFKWTGDSRAGVRFERASAPSSTPHRSS